MFNFCIPTAEALVPVEFQDNYNIFRKREIIEKWLQKFEVIFSDDILAAVDVVFA